MYKSIDIYFFFLRVFFLVFNKLMRYQKDNQNSALFLGKVGIIVKYHFQKFKN